ncbi:MAG: twin-arginine translocase TatA/TatE family subunit [Ignavibacteriae bacterium HGW-Ignavibacteriae-1]|nr:MAG: twin-arginine translocase TatA/TatE family subunit [Ignavibacteriae bacterium HGW-Ignavibacteriae-1]
MNLIMFGMPGGLEWVLILLAILLLFGAKKIPELMKGLGSGIKEFKKASNDITNDPTGDKLDK